MLLFQNSVQLGIRIREVVTVGGSRCLQRIASGEALPPGADEGNQVQRAPYHLRVRHKGQVGVS